MASQPQCFLGASVCLVELSVRQPSKVKRHRDLTPVPARLSGLARWRSCPFGINHRGASCGVVQQLQANQIEIRSGHKGKNTARCSDGRKNDEAGN